MSECERQAVHDRSVDSKTQSSCPGGGRSQRIWGPCSVFNSTSWETYIADLLMPSETDPTEARDSGDYMSNTSHSLNVIANV